MTREAKSVAVFPPQAGFAEHITKPVDIARLEEIMRKVAVAAGCGETG